MVISWAGGLELTVPLLCPTFPINPPSTSAQGSSIASEILFCTESIKIVVFYGVDYFPLSIVYFFGGDP